MTTSQETETTANQSGHGFGTLPVFLAGISTILGAIMFLRFGYAVGSVGLIGSLLIILLGHLVTIPTALAIAEIATNRKVEGGGEYFIISRSFGTTIGSVIGISLYLSQAVSVAFYLIAFAEAFRPLAMWFESTVGLTFDPRFVSIPATIALLALVLTKGADLGVKALYVVVVVLLGSLVLFFLGKPVAGFDPGTVDITSSFADADPFFVVFAICFPAFTGMTAGVGLSGDLANPRKSIPRGTLAATFVGMFVYVAIVWKLANSAPVDRLATEPLIMGDIALWGPIIPIGLACATLSSAIGSVLVAPRTLQAIGGDGSLPLGGINRWLARGIGAANEPRNTTLVTAVVAIVIVVLGNVDLVARLISMFFMVTYGALCAISFLEHFAGRPSYRPSFRSRWYISLFGALMCLLMMFQMDPVFAVVAIIVMAVLYGIVSRTGDDKNDLVDMFVGVMTQLTRFLQVRLQSSRARAYASEWRPSILMVDSRTFDRRSPLDFLRWMCHRHGFGTYLHFIKGTLNRDSIYESEATKHRLIELAQSRASAVYMDTIVSPSMISALAQSLQIPGVSGLSNNTVMFEFSEHDPVDAVDEVVQSAEFASQARKTLLVLRHGDVHFGDRKTVHIWLTWNDSSNANTMILLTYILVGHPEWKKAEINVFAALPTGQVDEKQKEFERTIMEGRLPISKQNVRFMAVDDVSAFRKMVGRYSNDADLTIIGFSMTGLRARQAEVFLNHPTLTDVLFVHAPHEIPIET